jgi:hypothetical protein
MLKSSSLWCVAALQACCQGIRCTPISPRSRALLSGGTPPPPELTPEILAKRTARAEKRAWQLSPEGQAAAREAAAAEVEAKREQRRQRAEEEASTLHEWAIRGDDGESCPLIDIGANLIKTCKGEDSLGQQLRRCQLTGVGRVIVTGTSVSASERALALVRASTESGQAAVRLHCTAGVHPHEARTCDANTIGALRSLSQATECVAIGECGLDYDRMFSARKVQLEWFERQAALAAELDLWSERDPNPVEWVCAKIDATPSKPSLWA